MKTPKNHTIRIILGIIFLTLGILGLFLPFLQGILFILIGAALLGFPPAKRLLKKIRKKSKKLLKKYKN
ncbi:MAG: PGPGW domain-containing protein [Nanoarchaeota archaeon]